MKQFIIPAIIALTAPMALAKLPAPDDAAKARAAEVAARTAWQGRIDGFQLCRAQDRVAAQYKKAAGSKTAAVPAQDVKRVAAPTSAAAPPASGTAVAGAPAAPCVDPGPFAYTPPAQKPLEAAGAHSPTGTAASAPNVVQRAAQMQSPPQPAKKP